MDIRHKRRFWRKWQETCEHSGEGKPTLEHNPRVAWRKHFAEFLGTPPEEHWLFGGRRFKPWASGDLGPPSLFNPFVADLMSKGGGLLSLLVLHLLSERPHYGNDIMREIEDRTEGGWESNPGAIYPLLTIMEQKGFILGEWEDQEKRTRRIYRLTPQGKQELERLKEVMRPKLEEAIEVLRKIHGNFQTEEED